METQSVKQVFTPNGLGVTVGMTDTELTTRYLAHGGTITKCKCVEPTYERYEGTLQRTCTRPVYDNCGRRIYQNLDKTISGMSLDETTRNYGKGV